MLLKIILKKIIFFIITSISCSWTKIKIIAFNKIKIKIKKVINVKLKIEKEQPVFYIYIDHNTKFVIIIVMLLMFTET